jgi:triacylglycerol lipase
MRKPILKLLAASLLTVAMLPATSFAAGYTQTKYPIVLVHGLFGFDKIGPVEYFYGIPSALRSGGAVVYTPSVSAANSTEVRGEQLLLEVKKVLAATGATKVNLIGHSHGGPTTRYVATVAPTLVASVTNIAGVNKGSVVVDLLLNVAPPNTLSRAIVVSVTQGLGTLLSFLSGSPTLPQASLQAALSLSTAGSAKFNTVHKGGLPTTACGEGAYSTGTGAAQVFYYSWSGARNFTNVLDILDAPLGLTGLAFAGAKNDGAVSSCSSHLGRVIRDDYGMNHLDEVNQLVGITNLFETNPVTVFRAHANRLQGMGL